MLSSRYRTIYTLITILLLFSTATIAETVRLRSGERQNTLVELYTSQGCSSCPPAEKRLGNLQQDPRLWKSIIPLAFHVDYWDKLGWKDKLAKLAFSQRQHRYRSEGAIDTVYTPALVVNGKEWRRGFGLRPLPHSDLRPGSLNITVMGNTLLADFDTTKPAMQPLTLNIALLATGLSARIERGENAGRQLAQDFSVLEFIQLNSRTAHWRGTLPEIAPPAGARLALAAWVSGPDTQTPLQAVGGWLPVDANMP